MIDFKGSYSRSILFRLIFLMLGLVAIGFFNKDFLIALYFKDQLPLVGMVINGIIVTLFVLGLLKVILSLFRYSREESALAHFIADADHGRDNATERMLPGSILYRRWETIKQLKRKNAEINHNALASMLTANESTKLSFIRFVNNILILTGVFGTIVSLSIALVETSNLLDTAQGTGDMGKVINGMSVALSTTITAIVCYVFYGYFYLKLSDAQTHFISGVEQATSLYLLPKVSSTPERIISEVSDLVRALRHAVEAMQMTQSDYTEASAQLRSVIANLELPRDSVSEQMEEVKGLLREGFRLPVRGR